MRIELEGTTFCVAGRYAYFDNADHVRGAIVGGGGKALKSMGQSVQVLVYGDGYSDKWREAEERGIPILREPELRSLVRDGYIDIDFTPPELPSGEFSLDDLLGEVRAILSRPPSLASWKALVEALELCTHEQVGPLSDYVSDQLDHWTPAQRRLCVAPRSWALAMLRGEDSPRYQAVRGVALHALDGNAKGVQNLLGCGHLSKTTWFDLSLDGRLSKTTLRTLAQAPWFATLEELTLGRLEPTWPAALDEGEDPARLTDVGFYPADGNIASRPEMFRALYGTRACARIERIVLLSRNAFTTNLRRPLEPLEDLALLPAFEHLEFDHVRYGLGARAIHPIDAHDFNRNTAALPASVRRRVRTLTLRTYLTGPFYGDAPPDPSPFTRLRELRLFDAGPYRDDTPPTQHDVDRVFQVDRMTLPDSLERIVTNAPVDAGAFARLIALRPDLEIVQDPHEYPFIT